MERIVFELKPDEEFIELMKLLKIKQIAQTGGHAKMIIDDGAVKVNGEVELRRRKKLRKADIVEIETLQIEIL